MDYTLYQLLWFFLIYAFLGWLMETALAAVRKRRLLNRGFLNAPFSPVYGLAAVLFAIFLLELRPPLLLFLGGMILATGLELSTGLLLERISHQKWWDYSDEPWNFNGHICLKYSLVWGLLALLCVFSSIPCWSPSLAFCPVLWVNGSCSPSSSCWGWTFSAPGPPCSS